ncbi:MAG TPA: substrate-binding domain-containing protein [Candidatus Binataceae bacterium]|nr:substrate-binding domain-containing protein [Candidatus Binataceae bacterium]
MAQDSELRRARIARGLTQNDLARQAGISRQALGAIEAGTYQPGVAVALKLARVLSESVENLFGEGSADSPRPVEAVWGGGPAVGMGRPQRVALAKVGGKLVAIAAPTVHLGLAPAAGTVRRFNRHRVQVDTVLTPAEIDLTLVVAGCDPGVALLADFFARHRLPVGLVSLPCSSRDALQALHQGRVHAAGVHLRDARTGEYNLASTRTIVGGQPTLLVNFAQWELGLVLAPNNPLAITGIADLARPALRIVNREPGAGARLALDEGLAELGLEGSAIEGYELELAGHLEVAAAVAHGNADAGVTIRVAAQAYGCAFLPMRQERYDLVIAQRDLHSEPVAAMMEVLSSRRFAAEVSQLCCYDTQRMGEIVARLE